MLTDFKLLPVEAARAEAFEKRHRNRCGYRGQCGREHAGFSYNFVPTGLGNSIKLVCLGCHKSKNITDHESW